MCPKVGNQTRTLLLSVLVSVLVHATVIVAAQLIPASIYSKPARGSYRLLAKIVSRQREVRWSAYNTPSSLLETRDNQNENGTVKHVPLEYPTEQQEGGPEEISTAEDVYLPRQLLSTAATPRGDIELQDILPPVRGAFQMHLWITRDGKVTQIDVEASPTPAWFVEQVVERFRQSDFNPATRDELAVPSILDVEVSY